MNLIYKLWFRQKNAFFNNDAFPHGLAFILGSKFNLDLENIIVWKNSV